MKKVMFVESSPILDVSKCLLLRSIEQALATDVRGEGTIYAVIPTVDEYGCVDNLINGLAAAAVLQARVERRSLNEETLAWLSSGEVNWDNYVWWDDSCLWREACLTSSGAKPSFIRALMKRADEAMQTAREEYYSFHPEDENSPYYNDDLFWSEWEPMSSSALRVRSLILYSLILYADGRMNLDRFCETVGRLVSMAA